MSAEQSTALTVMQRAVVALRLDEKKEQELRELAAKTADITTITNADGRAQVHAARMVLKNQRLQLKEDAETARDEAVKYSKAVIALEKRAIAIISGEEDRLQALQDAWDSKIEAEKQARIDAEMRRSQALRDRIENDIRRAAATSSSAMPSERIARIIEDVSAIAIDDSFDEFRQEADDAKLASLARLREIHAASVEREAEQARIKAEREELARLRAENEQRQAAERARIAEEERVAKEARDAEAAKQVAELKAQREKQEAEAAAERKRIADEEAAAKAIRETEAAKQAEELRLQREAQAKADAEAKALRDAEAKKLADERAAFEREQTEARRIKEEEERLKAEQARLASIKKPADAELLGVLAQHYAVPSATVVGWILSMDLSETEAA